MYDKDIRNDRLWEKLDGDLMKRILETKNLPTNRIRICTRGEPIADSGDIEKLRDIAKKNAEYLFWAPTRAWHDPDLRARIARELLPIENLRILCSTDPSDG
jgi:hypothetical protein